MDQAVDVTASAAVNSLIVLAVLLYALIAIGITYRQASRDGRKGWFDSGRHNRGGGWGSAVASSRGKHRPE
jgi:hypothetical protein